MKKITYAGIVVAMVLYVLRLIANTSFAIPLQMRLTGFETESLYSIWKVIHNFDVYTDMYKIPFTSSSFNYLYYFIYGSIIKCVLELFTLSDAWIPQIGRMVTFAACLAGVLFSYKFLTEIVDRSRKNRLLYLGLSFFVFWGPLTGFFSLAVRPDILAVVFELIGLCSFVKLFERRTRTAYLCLIFFSYLAWAIKPTNITFLSGLLVYFLWVRNLRGFFVCVSILSLAWSATLLLGSREYVNMVIFSHLKTPFLFSSTLRYLGHTCIKAAPIFLNIVVLLYLLYKNGRFLKFKGDFLADQHLFKLLICIFTISCGFAFLTSSKAGAGTNYYIPASVVGTFLVVLVLRYLISNNVKVSLISLSVIVTWAVLIGAMAFVLVGQHGSISRRHRNDYHQNIQRCVATLPEPVLAWDGYASLPWINPSKPHFVIAYVYVIIESRPGEEFERGGLKGLFEERYFRSVVTFSEEQEKTIQNTYRRVKTVGASECAAFDVWVPNASP